MDQVNPDQNQEPPPTSAPQDAETPENAAKPEGETQAEAKPEATEGGEGGEGEGGEGGEAKKEMPTFNFDLDEKPKKKKKPKQKKDKKAQKSYSREYYEALIPELNTRLAGFRKIFSRKDEANVKLANELATIEEDRIDVCEYLDRTLKKREIQVIELEETLVKLTAEYANYKVYSRERIIELQKLYESVEKQLKGEIELQERALSSLNEYRVLRDKALERYQTTHDEVQEMERQCKEELFNLEQKNAVQKNVLKKEVGARLHQVAEDFLHSNEIRNASYTRNLIRENITLKKTLDLRVKQNIRIMEEREKQFLKTKEVMESYDSLQQFSQHLQRSVDNKNVIIKRVTESIERIKMKFIDARRYRNLYDKAMKKDLFKSKSPHNFADMHDFLEHLKSEKFVLAILRHVQEQEIQRLREVLDKLMMALLSAASALNSAEDATDSSMTNDEIRDLRQSLRKNIVAELIPIVSGENETAEEPKDEEISTKKSTVYHPGSCGFILPQDVCDHETLKEFFHNTCMKSDMKESTPSQPSLDSLYGLEFGSYCYYSHTPSVQSSTILSPIDECTSEGTSINSAVLKRYREARCSCPKRRESKSKETITSIILKSSLPKMLKDQFTCCFGAECYPYCSSSDHDQYLNEIQPNKISKISTTSIEDKPPCNCK